MVFLKMAVANLMRRKGRTGLTILAVVLSGALLTGISVLDNSYLKSYERGVSQMLGNTDVGVARHLNASGGFFTEADLFANVSVPALPYYLNHTSRVRFTEAFTTFENNVERNAFSTTFMGLDPVRDRGFGYSEFLNVSPDVREALGRDPTELEDVLGINHSFVVVTTWVASVYNLTIDDEIMVLARNTTRARAGAIDPLNSSTWDRYVVKAIVLDHAEGEMVAYNQQYDEPVHYVNSRVIYMDLAEATRVANVSADARNVLFVGVQLSQLGSAVDYLQARLPPGEQFYVVNIKGDRLTAVRNSVNSMMMILAVFTVISLIVAVMLITNTLLMNIQEQKYETSILRAIGVYKTEVARLFLWQALFLASVGSLLGSLAGLGLSPLLKRLFFQNLGNSDFTLRLYLGPPLDVIGMPLLVNFAVTAVVGVFPALVATRLQIIEALRGLPPVHKRHVLKKTLKYLAALGVLGISYMFLARNQRNLQRSLVGLIPFILALLALTTVLIPAFSKGLSYATKWLLGSFRHLTERNMGAGENRKKANVTFMMFSVSIAFLVMVSNTLVSVRNIQVAAIPRYLGNDVVMYSEGSTFGMDELMLEDPRVSGLVDNATVFSAIRTKINGYGTFPQERQREPRVQTYIVEPRKLLAALSEVTLHEPAATPGGVETAFTSLATTPFTILLSRQLADTHHLDVHEGDEVTVDFNALSYNFTVVGVVDFMAGFSETWEDPWEVLPAETAGDYAAWISWETATRVIDAIYADLPDMHFAIKRDDHDADFWDMPRFNASRVRDALAGYEANGTMKLAARVWDENATSSVSHAGYDIPDVIQMSESARAAISEEVHVVFEEPTIRGQANFTARRNATWTTVQEALQSGPDQCVITNDVAQELNISVDDVISVWHENRSWTPVDPPPTIVFRKNFTVAGIINITQTLEAFNFDAMNPYVPGNNDVAADDSTAVIVDFAHAEFREAILNHSEVFEFWVELADYYGDHLRVGREIQEILGPDFASVDVKWYYTRDFAYAPAWLLDLSAAADQAETIEIMKEYLLAHQMPVIAWQNSDALEAQYNDQIEFQRAFFNVVLAFALLIAVLGIVINMLMAISARKREIGILRAMGTYKREILKVIIGESLILTTTGLILGGLVGTLCSAMLLNGLPLDTFYAIALTVDWATIRVIAVLVVVIAVLASVFPARNAMNLDVVSAVREL